MPKKDVELAEELNKRLTMYFSHENAPVRFLRAETDLLVRMVVSQNSVLTARIRQDEKRMSFRDDGSMLGESVNLNMALTDLALMISIARKLYESEAGPA